MTPADAPVLVLGMHRSGTSCLTGCLQELGLRLGEVHLRNPHNLKGNRERKDVMALNDALLSDRGGSWDAPVLVDEGSDERVRERDRIIGELEAAGRPWGFKDPRTLFTLPFWEAALPAVPRLVGTFRHPLAVARSLVVRNRFSLDRGLKLWTHYNERLLELTTVREVALVCFDLPPSEYLVRVRRLAGRLQLPGDVEPGFFEPQLRRSTPVEDACPNEYEDLYRRLLGEAECRDV